MDKVDSEALARLVSSISRFLRRQQASRRLEVEVAGHAQSRRGLGVGSAVGPHGFLLEALNKIADELADLAEPTDDEWTSPADSATRTFGHSKDFHPDQTQVVIGMAVLRDGLPVRCWTFPG